MTFSDVENQVDTAPNRKRNRIILISFLVFLLLAIISVAFTLLYLHSVNHVFFSDNKNVVKVDEVDKNINIDVKNEVGVPNPTDDKINVVDPKNEDLVLENPKLDNNDEPKKKVPVDQIPKGDKKETPKEDNKVGPKDDRNDDPKRKDLFKDEPKENVVDVVPKKEDNHEDEPKEVKKTDDERLKGQDRKKDQVKDEHQKGDEDEKKKREDEEFRKELDRLLKIRLDLRMKEANRIKELREGKKKTLKVKDPVKNEPKIVTPLKSDEVYKELHEFVTGKKYTVVKGDLEQCTVGRCQTPKNNFVYEYEMRIIAELAVEDKSPINLDDEIATIHLYRDFVKTFSKYKYDKKQYKESYSNFRKTRFRIEKHNKDPKRLFNMEYNSFADWGQELSSLSVDPVPNKQEKLSGLSKGKKALVNQEIHVDWRTKGVVLPVIHQGNCGSCWAVASTDAFNTFRAIKAKDKRRYSHQQLVDCVSPKYNCEDGGSQVSALKYIRDNKMCTERDYPYVMAKKQCSAYKCDTESGIKDIFNLSKDDALEFLKKNGPFITLFPASKDFLLYGDGIFNGSCTSKTFHSILVVGHGYDKEKKVNYWIVKNSWGEYWGEQGYFRILDASGSETDPSKQYCDFLDMAYGIV